MKKFLLSIVALVMVATFAQADEVTWTAADHGYENAAAVTEIAINDYVAGTFDQGTGTNAPKYYTTGDAVRAYAGNTLTITGNAITEIVFTFASGGGNNEITADKGTYEDGTWASSESEDAITFTVAGTSGHRRISAIKVTYTSSGAAPAVAKPTITPAAGTYFEPQTVTITSDVANAVIKYRLGGDELTYTAPFTVSETTTVEAWVETRDARSAIATSVITMGATYPSISALNTAATATRTKSRITFNDLLVTYVNGSNNYLTDGVSGLLVYGSNLGLVAGTRVSGSITGDLYTYNGLPELANPTADIEVLSEGNEVAPIVVAAAELVADKMKWVNMFVQVEKLSVEEAVNIEAGSQASNITFLAEGDVTLNIRNSFKLAIDAAAEQFYTVTGFLAIYNNDPQLYFLGLEEYTEPVEPTPAETVYIETDLTSQFSALTQNTNWTTGAGGTAGYTATSFCPTVTPNGMSPVQVCEFYEGNCNREGDILYQTVTGLAAGTYKIELYGGAAYTFGRGFSSEAFAEGTWNAGDKIEENTGVTLYATTSEGTFGGEIPIYYATNFPEGAATVTLEGVVVGSNGEMKIGMSKTSHSTNWHIIQLKGVTATVDAASLLAASVAKAQAIEESEVSEALYAELASVVEQNNNDYTTADEYMAAISAIDAVVEKAQIYIKAAPVLEQMKALTESTNVYTEEAYEEYYGQWVTKLDEGTLTADEAAALQNPFAVTSWHASITCDNFLLSAWDTNPDFQEAAYYINTWSTEGINDGTEFKTPFFEYWTGDGDSLGEKTLTATVTGLEPGNYDVEAWVRARAKNDTDAANATGITLQANDGEAVDVTEGEAVGQFNIGQYTATGTVGQDGTLKIKFIVAADNNISWLSFQNVKYAAAVPPTYPINIVDSENGSVAVVDGLTESVAGETIALTVTPDDGYELDNLTVTPTLLDLTVEVTQTDTGYEFTMPEGEVAITATFKEIELPEDPYDRALAVIEDGGTYRIFTEVGGSKLYLNTTGYLVENELKAATFTFAAVNVDNTLKPTGWNLGCKFTNPSLSGGASGDIVQTGHINVGGNDRNDWERQVLFLNAEGKYAIRSTNANSANWGANTYWDVITTDPELPAAGYSLQESYVWQIEANVDNRPDAFAKVQTWAATLQELEGLVTEGSQWISNAKDPSEGSYAALVDGDYTTFFHSTWHADNDPQADHYLQATLPEAQQEFYFYFKKRSQNNNNRPTTIVVAGSNDGETFTDITTISEGLPTGASPLDYTSAKIRANEAYTYLRFTVPTTSTGQKTGEHVYFTASEWYILPSNEMTDAAAAFMNVADYTDLSYDDIAAIDQIDEQIAAAKAQADLAADIEALKALADKLQAQVDASETYEDVDGIAATTTTGLTEIKNGAYTSADEITEAGASVVELAHNFFATIQPKADIDITDWYIVNPMPTVNSDGWTVTLGTKGNDWAGNTYDATNNVAEFWQYAGSSISQTITLPAGDFKLTAIALTRTDMTGIIYAGDDNVNIATVGNDVVNSRAQAAAWFADGNGINEVPFTMAEAGQIEIGLTTDAETGDHWTVWQSFTLTLVAPEPEPEPITGDVTGDGECDIEDYRAVINSILDEADYSATLDVNHDGQVNVADVTAVTNIILYGQWWGEGEEPVQAQPDQLTSEVRSATVAPSVLALRNAAGDIALDINSSAFNAFQLDITGISADAIRLGTAAAGHDIALRTLADGTLRVVVTAADNASFAAGTLLYMSAAPTALKNIVLADAQAKACYLDIDAATGIAAILRAADAAETYDLAGRRTSVSRGVTIVRQADGTTTKVLRK